MDADDAPVCLLGRRLPAAFERRVVVLAPGHTRRYDPAEWQDALVAVERGQIELECDDGSRLCFGRGSILWLQGLPLRILRSRGRGQAVLVAVSRRAAST